MKRIDLRRAAMILMLLPVGTLGATQRNVAPAAEEWSRTVQHDLARSEYEVRAAVKGTSCAATNRAQNFRTVFSAEGIHVQPRTGTPEEVPAWNWGLRLAGWGRDDAPDLPPASPLLQVSGNRIEYRRESLVEWYVNDERGLEQGFTIAKPLAGDGAVRLDLVVSGSVQAAFAEDGQSVEFLTSEGALAVRFDHLGAKDADGRKLPARFKGAHGDALFSILVDDAGAVYPITIDPLATSPAWTTESNQADAGLGPVATAGDVNGDGYSDVIVGASSYDNGETDEGRVFVYLGSAAGLATSPAWTAESNQAGAGFGSRVATAGDVNGDGFSDVLVGASLYDHGQGNEGSVFVWYGSPTGLGSDGTPANADWSAESDQADAGFGISVGPLGDVNGDGYGDVAVGSWTYSNGQAAEGSVFVWYGSAAGLGSNGTPANADWLAESDQAGARLGYTVAPAGDVDGDGYADLMAGAIYWDGGENDEGGAFVWHGGPSGLGANGTPANADWSAQSNQADALLGNSLSMMGDVNGDGYGDVIIAATGSDLGETDDGWSLVWYG